MDLIAEENPYEKYKKIALFILPHVHPHLLQTFTRCIKGQAPEMYIYDKYIKSAWSTFNNTFSGKQPHPPLDLQDMITSAIYIALSKEDLERALRTYRENRRVFKRNWFGSIKEEIQTPDKMKPRNPQYLKHYADSLNLINALNRGIDTEDETTEDIMLKKYKEIDDWKSDTSSLITDFYFLTQKPVKSIANGFMNDLTYESLIIIRNVFGGSIEGFNVNFPNEFMEHPLFSYRSTALEFEPELLENEISFLNKYSYEAENEETIEDVVVKFKPDFELPSVTEKNVSKVLRNYQIDLKQRELDMKDREIVTLLFNYINGENFANKLITVDLREFTRKVFGIKTPKHKHYENLIARLENLKKYEYTISVRNKETGELIETSTLGLLNYIHVYLDDNYFEFTPSDQWIQTYVQKNYTRILADSYKSIDSPQTKGIMMILQRERLTEYANDSDTKTLTLKYFRTHMKLLKIGNAALVKELIHHLDILKEKQVVVKDYTFLSKNSAVKIDFLPLEYNELFAYGFNTKKLEDKKNVIDTSYKELPNK